MLCIIKNINVKERFLRFLSFFFIKIRFLTFFYFLEGFLFSSGEVVYPTKPAKHLQNLLNSCIKQLLSDGFN